MSQPGWSKGDCPTGLPKVSVPMIATSAQASMELMVISLAEAVAPVVMKAIRTGATDSARGWKKRVVSLLRRAVLKRSPE